MCVCVCILAFDAMHLGGHIVSLSPLALVTTTTANFSASEASRDAKSPVGRWAALSFISFSACWRLSPRLPWRTTIKGNEKVKQHETTRFLCLLVFCVAWEGIVRAVTYAVQNVKSSFCRNFWNIFASKVTPGCGMLRCHAQSGWQSQMSTYVRYVIIIPSGYLT